MKFKYITSVLVSVLITFAYFSINSCSIWNPFDNDVELDEGQRLETNEYAKDQPVNRQEYSKFIAISLYRGVGIVRINADKKPELVKTINTKNISSHVKFDKEGFLWIAVPFLAKGDLPLARQIYVIDPHTERVYKRIEMPEELERPSVFVFLDNKVYLRGDREGSRIGIGSIDRDTYDVDLLITIDSTGGEGTTGMFKQNGFIYLNSAWCSLSDSCKLTKYDPVNNRILKTNKYGSNLAYDNNYIYTAGAYYGIEGPWLYKLDYDLNVVKNVEIEDFNFYLIQNDSQIYVIYHEFITIYDKESLDIVGRLSLPVDIDSYNTGFITNDILSINLNSIYILSEDKFYPNYFGLGGDSGGDNPPQLPEGYTLADYD